MSASPDAPPASPADANGIMKIINDAVAEAGSSAATAASEVEEAKRNARAASEVARKFMMNGGGGGAEQHQLHSTSDFLQARLSARGGSLSNGMSPRRSFGVSPRSPYSSMNGEGEGDTNSNSRSSTPRSTGSTGFFRNRRKAPSSLNGGDNSGGGSAMGHPPPSSHAHHTHALRSAHAEEMVALALELERAKQALEAEQMKHDETKSALQRASAKAAQLEGQMDQVLNDMETQRETLGRRVDSLEHELAHARMRLEAAEEDANLAFEIAKDNDERREEAERLLPLAQQEIEELKAQIAVLSRTRVQAKPRPPPPPPHLPPPTAIPTPHNQSTTEMDVADASKRASPKVVRFAENDQSFDAESAMTASTSSTNQAHASLSSSPSSSRMDRSLVSSGREVLRQFAAGVDPLNVKDLSIDVLIERRRRLHDRMKSLDGHMGGSSPSQHSFSTTSSLPTFSPMGSPLKDIEPFLAASAESVQREAMIRGAVALLKASGRRLGLSGRWWNEGPAEQASSTPRRRAATTAGTPESSASFSDRASTSHDLALETLTRHYCTSVEVLLDRKQKEIVELESLCALWEDQEQDKGLRGGAANR